MSMKPTFHWLVASSQDSTQIANTVKGLVIAASSSIIFAAAVVFHITLQASDVVSLATDLGVATGAIWTLYGLIMKVVAFFGSVQNVKKQ